jgi:hypothetical protein
VSDIRLKNPVSIDPKSEVDEEELEAMREQNSQNYSSWRDNRAFNYTYGMSSSRLRLSMLAFVSLVSLGLYSVSEYGA